MLIISLVLAVIGLAALVFAVITSNELVAWVCIGASVLGVVLLIIDALQERQRREAGPASHGTGLSRRAADSHGDDEAADYPADAIDEADGATDDSVSDDHTTVLGARPGRQQVADLVVADLMEVDENLAHRVEVVRHRRAHHVVGLLGQHLAHRPRADRHSDDDRVGAGGSQRSHRGEDARTGGDPVVNHDDRPAARVGDRSLAPVSVFAANEFGGFAFDDRRAPARR